MVISCSVCNAEYTSNSDISATRCGHVFHSVCLRDWLNRSSSCPVCQLCGNETFKIYLKFDNSLEVVESINALKSQLEQSLKNKSEIQQLLGQSEQNVLVLQDQIQVIQSELDLLQDQVKYLKIQTEAKSKEIAIKTNEIVKLREGLQQMSSLNGSQQQNNELSEELALKNGLIKSLEEELKQKSLELEKEIRNSTVLINDKMEIQKQLDSYNADDKEKRNKPHDSNKKPDSNDKTNIKSQQNSVKRIEKPPFVAISTETPLIKNYVRISGFQNINSSLEDVVLYLTKIMEIECKREDLENVSSLPVQKNWRNDSKLDMSLLVNFKTSQLKANFLTSKVKLSKNPATKNLRIFDHNPSSSKYELLTYTKRLKAIGFKFFFVQNGSVLARENHTSPFIKIYNKEQVDSMLKGNAVKASTESLFDCGVQFTTI